MVTIRHVAGWHLTAFTDVRNGTCLDRIIGICETATLFVETTTYGILQEAIPAAIDGGVFFVQPSGTHPRLPWDEGQQDYGAWPSAPVDRHRRQDRRHGFPPPPSAPKAGRDGAAADGTAFLLIFMRSENVIAFCQETHADGLIRGISVDEGDRAIPSSSSARSPARPTPLPRALDAGQITIPDAAVERPVVNRVVSDLAHLEGKSVWAYSTAIRSGPSR